MPEYVERSYHEALVNALAHRYYMVNGREVHIDIYDDRMEIYSPGGMPDGSMIQDRDPLTVASTRRNRFLPMYSTGLDIWSVTVVDLERLSVDMNFKLIIMRVKDHHSAQTDISLL